MQTVGDNFTSVLTSPHTTEKRLTMVVEFYTSSAEPSGEGFDPRSADFLFGVSELAGVSFLGIPYDQRVKSGGFGDIDRTIKKKLSGFSLTLMNDTRETYDFEKAVGFEGLVCVARIIDRSESVTLADSLVEFTGRCLKPDSFPRGSESARIEVEQICNQVEVLVPRRKLTPNDEEGRSPSDPLFEGFRFVQRAGSFNYPDRVLRGGFLGAIGLKKNVTRTMQYSSHSDAKAEQYLPLALGRVSIEFINFAYEDKGTWMDVVALACEGEIAGFENLRCVTPGFYIPGGGVGYVLKRGEPGGTGEQTIDRPDWIAAAYYSNTAYGLIVIKGTTLESDDAAPQIAAVVMGKIVPLPDSANNFTLKDWTDNGVFLSRWLLNDKNFFNLSNNWFEDDEIVEEASYCDHLLVDTANTDKVLLPSGQQGIAGTKYRYFKSTAAVTPAYFDRADGDYTHAVQEADYNYYDDTPPNGDYEGGVVTAPATKLRRRYTTNVLVGEEQPAFDFLHDTLFASFNGYMVQKANGKLSIRSARPADFGFVSSANTVGSAEIHINNINPFAAKPGRILIGANLPTSEVRKIISTRYDTSVNIPISASGGVSSSASVLGGGSSTTAPFATLTVTSEAGAKTINLDGYALVYNPAPGDTTATVAGMIAALVNSHNELNKYIKAEWIKGESTVKVSSRIGFLGLDAPLDEVHLPKIPDPATAPTLTAAAGSLAAGTYRIGYSYQTIEGETLVGPLASIAVGSNQDINVGAVPLPNRVTAVNWYASAEPNGVRERLYLTSSGGAWTLSELPSLNNDTEPVTNTTAAECHRIAMAFTDVKSPAANLDGSNVIDGSFTLSSGEKNTTNVAKMKYREASEDFALTELKVKDSRHIKKVKKQNVKEIQGAAVDNYHQASRLLNQFLAVNRDGSFYNGLTSDGEALLLEEGDIICVTDESVRQRNEPIRVESLKISPSGYPTISVTGRKYRRWFYDDQVKERLVPLPLPVNQSPNTSFETPFIYQSGASQNTSVNVAVERYTAEAKFRKIQVSGDNAFTVFDEDIQDAVNEPGGVLNPLIVLTRDTNLSIAETRYVRVAHSSNGTTFGEWSNVLMISFTDNGGGGGTPPSEGESGPHKINKYEPALPE